MSSKQPYKEYVIAALLHDVGKLIQRAKAWREGIVRKHVDYSVEFLNQINNVLKSANLDYSMIEDLVRNHHKWNYGIAPFDEVAACERKPGDEESGEKLVEGFEKYYEVPFQFVISKGETGISDSDNIYVPPYPLKIDLIDEIKPLNKKDVMSKMSGAYGESLNLLYSLASNLNRRSMNYHQLIETIIHVLKATTLLTPAAVYGVSRADTSLYAHSILTAALASTIISGERKFRLLGIDIAGIQQYITRVLKTKLAMVMLRGRSLYITLIQKILIRKLINELNEIIEKLYGIPIVSMANALIDTGGEVIMLIPSINDEKLREIADKLENKIVQETNGQLRVFIAWTEEKQLSCSEFKGDNFRYSMTELQYKLFKRRISRFIQIDNKKAHQKCDMCGMPVEEVYQYDLEVSVCRLCKMQLDIGKYARNLKMIIYADKCPPSTDYPCIKILDQAIILIGSSYELTNNVIDEILKDLSNSVRIEAVYSINDTVGFIRNLNYAAYGYVFTNSYLPSNETSVKSLDEITKHAFTVKMDGNNMGVYKYISQETPSKYVTFSNILSLIFDYYANVLIHKRLDYRNNIYVIYSGGDDSAVIGDYTVFKYISEIVRYAESWGFRVSAGAVLHDPEEPVLFTWDEAGKREDIAKAFSRENSLIVTASVKGLPLAANLNQLLVIYEDAKRLVQELDVSDISERECSVPSRLIYRIMDKLASIYYYISQLRMGQHNIILLKQGIARELIEYNYIVNRISNRKEYDNFTMCYREYTYDKIEEIIKPILSVNFDLKTNTQSLINDVLLKIGTLYLRLYLIHIIKRTEEAKVRATELKINQCESH